MRKLRAENQQTTSTHLSSLWTPDGKCAVVCGACPQHFGSGQHTALDPVSGFPKPWERRRRVRSLLLQAAPTVGEKDGGATRLGRSGAVDLGSDHQISPTQPLLRAQSSSHRMVSHSRAPSFFPVKATPSWPFSSAWWGINRDLVSASSLKNGILSHLFISMSMQRPGLS